MYLIKLRQDYNILLFAMFSDPEKAFLPLKCCYHPGFSGKSISYIWKAS